MKETETTAATAQTDVSASLFDILRAESYWTAGIFYRWMEGRGARAFQNCSIKHIDGGFRSKSEALAVAEKAIKDRMLSGVRWNTAKATASFLIPRKTCEKIGDLMDATVGVE